MRGALSVDVARDALARGLSVRLTVEGQSMAPALAGGSEVLIVPSTAPLARGQVVAYARGARLVVHRVIRVGESQVITRGDARLAADAPIGAHDVLGRVELPTGRPIPAASLRQRLSRRARQALSYLR